MSKISLAKYREMIFTDQCSFTLSKSMTCCFISLNEKEMKIVSIHVKSHGYSQFYPSLTSKEKRTNILILMQQYQHSFSGVPQQVRDAVLEQQEREVSAPKRLCPLPPGNETSGGSQAAKPDICRWTHQYQIAWPVCMYIQAIGVTDDDMRKSGTDLPREK